MEAINNEMSTVYGTLHYGASSPGVSQQGTTATSKECRRTLNISLILASGALGLISPE